MIIVTKDLTVIPATKPGIYLYNAWMPACISIPDWQHKGEDHLGPWPFHLDPQGSEVLLNLAQGHWCPHEKEEGDSSLLLTNCGSLPVTYQILAPGKQQTSLDHKSGQQMGASVLLNSHPLLALVTSFCSFQYVVLVSFLPVNLVYWFCLLPDACSAPGALHSPGPSYMGLHHSTPGSAITTLFKSFLRAPIKWSYSLLLIRSISCNEELLLTRILLLPVG